MRHGFIRVAAASPGIRVGDCAYNAASICAAMDTASGHGVRVLTLPELCVTGCTCGDLFSQRVLLECAAEALVSIADFSQTLDLLTFVGLPVAFDGRLYSCAAAVYRGVILGFVPRTFIPSGTELRGFSPAPPANALLTALGREVPFGTSILFGCGNLPGLLIGVELGSDLAAPIPPSTFHASAGATLIVNLSSMKELIGAAEYRRMLVLSQSSRLISGYVLAEAGAGESTSGGDYSGHGLIAENGRLLAQSRRYSGEMVISELDVERIDSARRTSGAGFPAIDDRYARVGFELPETETPLSRPIRRHPFIPSAAHDLARRASEILIKQSAALADRIDRAGAQGAVVGVSGGVDSALTLAVSVRAMDILGRSADSVNAVSMSGFGTSKRSYDNARRLSDALGCNFRDIDIRPAVSAHFNDIAHDPGLRDTVYENAQARERTQILMDIANQQNCLHVGTGNMSELALGWSTYGGDQISMYNVNANLPKTLIKHIIEHIAKTSGNSGLSSVLRDILDSPVSPELLPADGDSGAQCTERIIGPYELHDFFIYYFARWGFPPSKIYRLAEIAFSGCYEPSEIKKWLGVFFERFFANQFKRSCSPDGPRIGSVSLSPFGDWVIPADMQATLWRAELNTV